MSAIVDKAMAPCTKIVKKQWGVARQTEESTGCLIFDSIIPSEITHAQSIMHAAETVTPVSENSLNDKLK